MPRIFVDVDDTLKLIEVSGDERPNMPLVDALALVNGAFEIVVWTVVDCDLTKPNQINRYAYQAAHDCLNRFGVHTIAAIDKDFRILHEGDIAVDDTPIVGYPGKWMTANEFTVFAKEWRAAWDESHAYAVHGGGH